MKKAIACHNAIPGAATLTFDAVKDPSSDLYANLQSPPSLTHVVPNSTRRTAIELHCLKERCEEEIALLKTEMERLVAFLRKQINVLAIATNKEVTQETAKLTLGLNSLFLSTCPTTNSWTRTCLPKWMHSSKTSRNVIQILKPTTRVMVKRCAAWNKNLYRNKILYHFCQAEKGRFEVTFM